MKVIYKITSKINPLKFYIGSAVNYKNRMNRHIYSLKINNHKNLKIQNHFNKYGVEDLQFSIIEFVEEKEMLIKREQFYIDLLNPTFNICRVAGSSLGVKRSEEYKLKMSASKKGKKHRSICNIEKSIRQTGIKRKAGYKHTEEAKLKISKNNGKTKSIIQMNLEGVFLQEWGSIKSAAETLQIHGSGISMCCRGVIKKTANYKWKYKI